MQMAVPEQKLDWWCEAAMIKMPWMARYRNLCPHHEQTQQINATLDGLAGQPVLSPPFSRGSQRRDVCGFDYPKKLFEYSEQTKTPECSFTSPSTGNWMMVSRSDTKVDFNWSSTASPGFMCLVDLRDRLP